MDSEQRKYLRERVEIIARTKSNALISRNNKAMHIKWDTDEEVNFILKGEATLKSYEQIADIITKPKTVYDLIFKHPNYYDFYDYPAFVPTPQVEHFLGRIVAITDEANRLKDACMFSDNETELLAKLSAFESKEF